MLFPAAVVDVSVGTHEQRRLPFCVALANDVVDACDARGVAVRARQQPVAGDDLLDRPVQLGGSLGERDQVIADALELGDAYIGSLLLLTTLAIYGQWVLAGVVEEKNNRVVELILSTVQPRHLLAGKVIGIGLLGLSQLVLVVGLGATLIAAGVFDAPASLGGSLALVVPWFALGFARYAVAYAAAGALASRQQDANSAGQTVTYTLLAAYFAGYVALSADPNGTLAHVLTVFPLTAPLVLPARSALVGVPVWEQVLAVVLVLGSIYALVRMAGRVYAHGLLHSGPRLRARTAWRQAHPR